MIFIAIVRICFVATAMTTAMDSEMELDCWQGRIAVSASTQPVCERFMADMVRLATADRQIEGYTIDCVPVAEFEDGGQE